MTTPLLRVDGLHAGYGPIEVLKGVSLEVRPGEIVTLIGANGAGKTTTLFCLAGVNRLRAGQLVFDGEPLDLMQAHQLVQRGIVLAPEGRKIFPRLSVLENLKMGAFLRRDAAGIRQDLDQVCDLFPVLAERLGQPGGTLSGGEQQMLAIGRGLMSRPRLLMMDEPSMGIAPLVQARIFEAIRALNQQGLTMLIVEQNARLILKLAQRGYVLETGSVVLSGSAAELLNHPRVKEAYLGGA